MRSGTPAPKKFVGPPSAPILIRKCPNRESAAHPYGSVGGDSGKPCYNNLLSKDLYKQTKKIKNLKKKYNRQKKRSKRGREYVSSDSSSSSSSDSE